MYTRFKSQKSGIKLGINTITNTARNRVVIPATSCSSKNTDSTSIKKIDLNNNVISVPISVVNSTASVVLDDEEAASNDLKNENSTIPLISNAFDPNEKQEQTKGSKSNKSKKPVVVEEPIDPVTITYVKSMWEKYSEEIGTEDGPLCYFEENTDYPHLNGFVAFDMEHWWAERSISCMINEKSSLNSIEEVNETEQKSSTPTNLEINTVKNCLTNLKLNSQVTKQMPLQNINLSQLCLG